MQTKATYILIFLSLLMSYNLQAGKETYLQRLEGTDVVQGKVLSISDGQYPFMKANGGMASSASWQNTFGVKQVKAFFQLGHDEFLQTQVLPDYKLELTIRITPFDLDGNPVTPFDRELKVNYSSGSGLDIHRDVAVVSGYHHFNIEIVSITDNQGNPILAPENIHLEGRIEVERYYAFTPLTKLQNSALTHQTADLDNNGSPDQIELNWSFLPGAEVYEVEWTHVNNYTVNGGTASMQSTVLTDYDFEHNSSRVRVKENFYKINLIYDQGYLVYRVRGIGKGGADFEQEIFGLWSSENGVGKASVFNWPHRYEVTSVYKHEQALNWKYSATYAEGGRRKEALIYADGTTRARQEVTKLNSINKTAVGEQIYDFQGRPAVQVMMTPTEESVLKYFPNHNQNLLGKPYSKLDFDLDQPAGATQAKAMHTQSGSSKYYSSQAGAAPDGRPWQNYVPDAEGYPFIQTEYTPDNTGRVRRQGQAGATHQLGKGHEVQMFYGQPNQVELDRLFGYNVGYKSRYQKNATVDANGQVSVNYLAPDGKTIATALAGESPDNLIALPSNTGITPMVVNLLGKSNVNDTDTPADDNNRFNSGTFGSSEDGLAASTSHLVVQDQTPLTLDYSLKPPVYEVKCNSTAKLELPVAYNLEINIKDQDGQGHVNSGSALTAVGLKQGSVTVFNEQTNNLPVGQYQVYKRLTVDQITLDQNKAAYIQYMQDNGCVQTLTDFQNYFLTQVDSTGCSQTCENCLEDLILDSAGITLSGTENESDWMGYYSNPVINTFYTLIQWRQGYRDCKEACENYLSPCEAMKGAMLADIRPGGQYGLILDSTGAVNPSQHPLSIYNEIDVTTMTFTDIDGTTQLTFPNLNAFVMGWQDQWAEQLLYLHPEFCYLEWCFAGDERYASAPNGVSSNRFNHDIILIDNHSDLQNYFTGLTGLVDPTPSLRSGDPFFQLGSNSIMTTSSNFSYAPSLGTPISLNYSVLANVMLDSKLNNYKGSGLSLWDFVVQDLATRGWYGVNVPAVTGQLSGIQYDQVWNVFKFMYLSEKQHIEQQLVTFYAVENGCYNGCIGDHIPGFPLADGFVRKFLFDNQPCSVTSMEAYADKERRFVIPAASVDLSGDPKDIAQRMENQGDYQLYLNTGQCPNDFDLEFFLNGLAQENKLTTTTLVQPFEEFTVQLYRNISGLDPTVDNYMEYTWSPTISSSTQLDVDFTVPSGTPQPHFASNIQTCLAGSANPLFQLNIQNNGFQPMPLTWGAYGTDWEITRFQDLSSSTGTPSTFSVLAKVLIKTGTLANTNMEVVMTGQTCVKLGGCSAVLSDNSDALQNNVNAQNGFATPCPSNNLLEGALYLYERHLIELANGVPLPHVTPVSSSAKLYDLASYLGATSADHLSWNVNAANPNKFSISFQSNTIYVNVDPIAPATGLPTFTSILGAYPLSDQLAELEVQQVTLTSTTPLIYPRTENIKLHISLSNSSGFPIQLTDCCEVPGYAQQNTSSNQLVVNGDFEQGNGYFTSDLTYQPSSSILLSGNYMITDRMSDTGDKVTCEDDHTVLGRNALVAYHTDTSGPSTYKSQSITLTPGKVYDFSFWWNVLWQDSPRLAFKYEVILNGTSVVSRYVHPYRACDWVNATENFSTTQVNNQLEIRVWGVDGNREVMIALDDISIQESGSQCLPCTAEVPLAIDCYSAYDAYQTYFTTVQASLPSIYIMTKKEFCNGNYKYYSTEYLAYLQGLQPRLGNDLFSPGSAYHLTWPQFITGNYGPFVSHYLTYVDGVGFPSSNDPRYISLGEFAQNGISVQCVDDYLTALSNSNNSNLGSITSFCNGHVKLDPCPRTHKVDPPTLTLPDPCLIYLTNVALLNAQTQYDSYINGISESFESDYLTFALDNVIEQFTMEYTDKEYHYTIYEYDQAGNLASTVPPAGVDKLDLSTTLPSGKAIGQAIRTYRDQGLTSHIGDLLPKHKMRTRYRYNTLNQLVWQDTPDGGITRFWYDRLGRIVASQDAAQHPDKYSFTKYDKLGRMHQSGQFTYSGTLTDLTLNDPTYPFNLVGNQGVFQYFREVTYSEESDANVLVEFSNGQNNLRNRVSGQYYYEAYDLSLPTKEEQLTSANHFSYDIHGNVVEYLTENTIMPAAHRYKLIRNEYDLVGGLVNEYAYQPGKSDAFYHEYEYDDDLRLTNVHTSTDQVNWQQDAKYFYYDHGPQAREELGEYKVQAVDKAYTINGWIKGVNSNALTDGNDIGNDGFTASSAALNTGVNKYVGSDVYGFSEHYFVGDYNSRTGLHNQFLSNAEVTVAAIQPQPYSLYNGNIGMEAIAMKDLDEKSIDPIAKTFRYDQLNRIKNMNPYLNHTGTTDYTGITNQGGEYQVAYSYDANGNLLSLQRNAQELSGSSAMDKLTYWYYKKDGSTYNPQVGTIPANAINRLAYVTDSEGNKRGEDLTGHSSTNYTYYPDGNLKSDPDEQIQEITWTIDNKVKTITRTPGSTRSDVEYVYDFGGERIAKVVKVNPTDPSFDVIIHYAKSVDGNIMATYFENKGQSLVGSDSRLPSFRTEEHYVYGTNRIAVTSEWKKENNVMTNPDGFEIQTNNSALSTKKYQLSNLRNDVLATVDGKKQVVWNTTISTLAQEPDVIHYNDYYPFGMEMIARKGSSEGYRFGFNGQLKSLELSGGNTTALFWEYDARVARRWNLDPKPVTSISSYVTFQGNPILNYDPLGDTIINGNKADLIRIADDVNRVFGEKYKFSNAVSVIPVTRTREVDDPKQDGFFNLWGRLGHYKKNVDKTYYALSVNKEFDWKTDRYTSALFDVITVDSDIYALIVADVNLELMNGYGGGFTDHANKIRLSTYLHEYGEKQGTMGMFLNKWAIGMVFIHEALYHIHPLGAKEENQVAKNGAKGPNISRTYYKSKTGKTHPAGSNQNPLLSIPAEKRRIEKLKERTGRKEVRP